MKYSKVGVKIAIKMKSPLEPRNRIDMSEHSPLRVPTTQFKCFAQVGFEKIKNYKHDIYKALFSISHHI